MNVFSVSNVIEYLGQYIVEIYINGEFWDHRTFTSRADAETFRADPLATDRRREQLRRAPELDRSYISLATRISRGRRIAPKPASS